MSLAARMRPWALAVSGATPILGLFATPPSPTLLIYSLFAVDIFRGPRRRGPITFWLSVLAAGAITETLSWVDNFLKCNPAPGLMHPQLVPDLIHGIGFYSTWALAWLWLLGRYQFTLPQVFVTQGLYGVIIEQQGRILLAGLMAMPVGLVLWIYVFLVYGSTIGIAYNRYRPGRQPESAGGWRKYPIALLALLVAIVPGAATWTLLISALGLNPLPAPICERPLW
jgi:hypothetical protein